MPINNLPILDLGEEDQYHAYERWFEQQIRVGHVDPLGRAIYVAPSICHHICYKGENEDGVELWSQRRAQAMGWLTHLLTDPDEIRWNHQFPRRQAFLLTVSNQQKHRYYASVSPIKKDKLTLHTAFPCTEAYWRDAQDHGRSIYRKKQR